MLTQLASFSAKSIRSLSQLLKKGRGEAAPGLVALKIDSNFIANKHKNVLTKILITGTNGKTTTTNLISQILSDQNIPHITNLNGSNLERGIASALLDHKNQKTTLWECDEAAFVKISQQVEPTHIIINNLFRDQLDRYGEINILLDKWTQVLKELPSCHLIINSDDPNLSSLAKKLPKHKIHYYSLKTAKSNQIKHSADARFCPECQTPLKYTHINFSHLGSYSCNCGFSNPKPHYFLKNIEDLYLSREDTNYSLSTKLKGNYNLYNILASFSLAHILNLNIGKTINSIKKFKAIKGRQEIIKINDKKIHLYLVKNPTGFNQVIDTLQAIDKKLTLLIALNDNIADGTDVSWIWDVDFESLNQIAKKIIVTGDRVHDLALRLKYSDSNLKNLLIQPNKEKSIKTLLNQSDNNLYILPTYTSLWELRTILLKKKS